MKHAQNNTTAGGRLRMVFDDAVVMLKLSTGATYGDVAALWDGTMHGHGGAMVCIAVTIDPCLSPPSGWLFPAMAAAQGAPLADRDHPFRPAIGRTMTHHASFFQQAGV